MSFDRVSCGGCGKSRLVCPECDGHHVTPMDNPQKTKPNDIIRSGEDGEYEYTNICWDCGYKETVTVTIEREVEL